MSQPEIPPTPQDSQDSQECSRPASKARYEGPSEKVPPMPPANFNDDIGEQKRWRAAVWKHSNGLLAQGGYINYDGQRQPLSIDGLQDRVVLYADRNAGGSSSAASSVQFDKTNIQVINSDCVETAVELALAGKNPMLMDAASRGHFGGGYRGGSRAQEEELCRRSFLAEVVHPLEKHLYPLPPQSGIYAPAIPFFKEGALQKYGMMSKPVPIGIGIVAAYNKPPLIEDGTRLDAETERGTKEMIRTFFHMAQHNGHQSVVIVPLGCGAFKNPAIHLAELFTDVLQHEFANAFSDVIFSVLDDHNAYHKYNPLGNFAAFGLQIQKIGGVALSGQGQPMSPEELMTHAEVMRHRGAQNAHGTKKIESK